MFYSNVRWPNKRRPFKISIEATSVTFTENGAQCYRNWWKATICFCLFLCSLLLFHYWRVMRGATRQPLLGFWVSSPSSYEFLRHTSFRIFSLVKIKIILSFKGWRRMDNGSTKRCGSVISCVEPHRHKIKHIRWIKTLCILLFKIKVVWSLIKNIAQGVWSPSVSN